MGDEVLRRMGKTLQEVVRTEDTVARYGGEEFAIVAIGASHESSVELVKRLREGIGKAVMPESVGKITVSMGIASSVSAITSAAEIINQADAALYRAKKNGRDRIEIFELNQSSNGD
jgi:diguanylate cyclase (GGDEF)-like protein